MDKPDKTFSDAIAFEMGLARSFYTYMPRVGIFGEVKDTMDRELDGNPRYHKGQKVGYVLQGFSAGVLLKLLDNYL